MRVYFSGSSIWSGVPAAAVPWSRYSRRLLLALGAVAVLSSGQAVAQDAAGLTSALPTVAAGTQTGQADKNGKVCQYEVVTGSRMKKRVCYTPEQWAARESAAKQLTREMDGKSISKDANGG